MPKFVIERQYLVPMYQHIVVEAENLDEACKKSINDDIDWDTQEMDSDGARRTTLTGAKRIPDGYSVSPERSLIIAGGGFFIVGNARRATTKCLPSRLTRSGDIGTAALSFLGTITGKLSSSAAALKFCRRMRGSF